MSDLTDYAENKLVDHVLGTTAYVMPTVYVALYTVAPGEAGGGTELPASTGYARQAAAFGAAANGSTSNSALISFGPNTTTDWGTVVAAALIDSATLGAGNILAYKTLPQSRTAYIGDRINFEAGTLTFSLT